MAFQPEKDQDKSSLEESIHPPSLPVITIDPAACRSSLSKTASQK